MRRIKIIGTPDLNLTFYDLPELIYITVKTENVTRDEELTLTLGENLPYLNTLEVSNSYRIIYK